MKPMTLPRILKPFGCDELIRLGKDYDGGYLVNKPDIEKTDTLISFGIGEDCSFEIDFFDYCECKIKAYDKSAKSDVWLNHNSEITYKNIGIDDNEDVISIESINFDTNSFLKCDIDGGEYLILNRLIADSKLFTGMVIEFHDISQYHYFNLMTEFIAKTRLQLVHTHVNNYSYLHTNGIYVPDVVELTFSSSDVKLADVTLPNMMDMPNNPSDEDFYIMF
jgi:hypothetical protein